MEKLFRGSKFDLDINKSMFNALYFTKDIDFAKRFGAITEYKISDDRKELNLAQRTKLEHTLVQIAKRSGESYARLKRIYDDGDFWVTMPDKDGFNFKLLNLMLDYANSLKYDNIRMVEHYTKGIKPIIYIVLNKKIIL